MNSGTFDKDAFDFLAGDSGTVLDPQKERAGDERRAASAPVDPGEFDAVVDIQQRVDEVRAAANPLLEAARRCSECSPTCRRRSIRPKRWRG